MDTCLVRSLSLNGTAVVQDVPGDLVMTSFHRESGGPWSRRFRLTVVLDYPAACALYTRLQPSVAASLLEWQIALLHWEKPLSMHGVLTDLLLSCRDFHTHVLLDISTPW